MDPSDRTAEIRLSRFVIEPDEVGPLLARTGGATVESLLAALVPAAQRLARPPISRFPVGAVGLGLSGRIYIGVNLEFPGLPLHHSVHAEQFLVANAALHGEARLRSLAVSHAPCGHCRQFLQELRLAPQIRIRVTADDPGSGFRPLSDFLPRPFGPADLLADDLPLLLEPHSNRLGPFVGDPDPAAQICNGVGGVEARLRAAAEAAARAAHAHYSGCAAGFAVADGEGRVSAGSYAESAAYNPSLGPVQAAVVAYVAGGGKDLGRIAAGALVEGEGAAVSHEGTARIFFQAVAPLARLSVYRFRPLDVE